MLPGFHCAAIAQGRLVSGAIWPCTLLLPSPPSGQCCRLLKAGEEVLWHDEFKDDVVYTLFDGKGGARMINFEQASTVGFLLPGTYCTMQNG